MKNLAELLDIEYPIIVAPMFLISNVNMVVAACEAGATAAFPALNYRSLEDLKKAIHAIRARTNKPFGVNLIVNKSNIKYLAQLELLIEERVDFIITSLGSPEETIRRCKAHNIKVFCDVIDAKHAKKVENLGADAVIAVNSQAGGHCGSIAQEALLKEIQSVCNIPIISAGGIGSKQDVQEALRLGAIGVSVGTIFLACEEAEISRDYRQALIDYHAKDIVLTTKMSGSHLTVINTPYVQSLGTKASFLEKLLLKNKWLKKYVKMLLALKGMRAIKKSALNSTYETVWCAGPSIEYITSIRPLKEIMKDLI